MREGWDSGGLLLQTSAANSSMVGVMCMLCQPLHLVIQVGLWGQGRSDRSSRQHLPST